MFRCHFTGKVSKAREMPRKLVTHVRPKTYRRYNSKSGLFEVVGSGTEIVTEVLVSQEYYNKLMLEGFEPQVVDDQPEVPEEAVVSRIKVSLKQIEDDYDLYDAVSN
jgi:hypothetical protein